MSRFSDLLNEVAEAKNVSTPDMASYCGTDRTTVYRFRKGIRTPENPEMVGMMADYMQLNLAEKQQLLDAYEITVVGEDNYFRRQAVGSFLESFLPFDMINNIGSDSVDLQIPEAGDIPQVGAIPVTGQDELVQLMYNALAAECYSPLARGRVDLVMNPQHFKIMETMCTFGRTNASLQIRHVFPLNSQLAVVPEGNQYSMDVLRRVLPVCIAGFDYEPHYYYRDQASADPFPIRGGLLVTTGWAITFADDLSCGIFYDKPDMVEFYQEQFDHLLQSCPRMLRRSGDLNSIVEMIAELQVQKGGSVNSVVYLPQLCVLDRLSEEQIAAHIDLAGDAEAKAALIAKTMELKENGLHMADMRQTVILGTVSGIRRFLETGRFDEVSDDLYTPLSFDERAALLRTNLEAHPHSRVRLLKKDLSTPERGLVVYAADNMCFIEFREPADRVNYLAVSEPGVIHAFSDFFRTLPEEDFYPDSEVPAILEKLIAEARG